MKVLAVVAFAVASALAASPAYAHGGAYRGGGGIPSGGAVPPGTADPGTAVTQWEAWWAANKEELLRLHERMRESGAAITPGADDGEPGNAARDARARDDERVREDLKPFFREALNDSSFEVRTAACIAIGKLGDREAIAELRKMAEKDDHKDVRDSALLALGMLQAEETIPYLVGILSDRKDNTRHRSFAAFGLGMIGGDDATAMLLRFVKKGGPKVSGGKRMSPPLVASAVVALGITGNPEVIPSVRKIAFGKGHDDLVRSYAVLSLGRLGDRDSLEDIGDVLRRDKDANMRRAGAIALGRIATTDDAASIAELLRATSDSDPLTRHFAAVSLGRMADDELKVKLAKMFDAGGNSDKPFLALALGLAKHTPSARSIRKELSRAPTKSVRGAYCTALGLMGDQGSIPLIEVEAQTRGDIWLPGYAALALGMLQSRRSAEMLRERLKKENDSRLRMNLGVALGLLHDPAARQFFIETLESKDGTIYERGSAAMSLGVLRINAALPNLKAVYADKKEKDLVRAMAIVSLGVLADPSPLPKLSRFAIDNNYGVSVDPLNEVLSIL